MKNRATAVALLYPEILNNKHINMCLLFKISQRLALLIVENAMHYLYSSTIKHVSTAILDINLIPPCLQQSLPLMDKS